MDNAIADVLSKIGYKFYVARHIKREKITSVASNIGVSHPVISKIENGTYKPLTIDLVYRLMSYYNLSFSDLFL